MKGLIKEVVIAIAIALVIMQFIKPTIVKESSMEPTMYENNYILLNRQAYNLGEPKRGDIVVFHTGMTLENGKEKMLIKRVIGLPGETISVKEGNVYIDGQLLEENYIKDGYTDGFVDNQTIPEGKMFVMGDNRLVSVDSRLDDVGLVEIDDVLGKAFVRLYPFNKITLF